MKSVSVILTIALLTSLAAGAWMILHRPQPATPQLVELSGTTMGGNWSIKLRGPPAGHTPQQLQEAVSQLLERLENEMSSWRWDSTVSRFSRSRQTDWFPVSRELAEVVAEALRVSGQTGGAFDITVAPIVELWGFGPSHAASGPRRVLPSDDEIAAARQHVGYRLLECRLNPPALRKSDPLVTIDLGGIGKGFAADKVGTYLDSLGIKDYLVAVGGELRARGSGVTEDGWIVGIETPTADVRRVLQTLTLRNASLSTSGDYRNFIEIAGQRYCHEIDPRAGRPIHDGPASVSVIHASGATADAMATAMMVLGVERGEALAREHQLAVLFITRGEGRFEQRQSPQFPSSQSRDGDQSR